MNISHLLLCTSLLAAPVCAAQGLTETETETPASASRLPAPLAQKIASGDFDGLQTELRSTLLKAENKRNPNKNCSRTGSTAICWTCTNFCASRDRTK